MAENVNPVNQRREIALNVANHLDAKDGKTDGKIDASVWNEFVDGKGGKEIKYSITLENAQNSISTYLARNSAKSGESVQDLAEKWMSCEEPKNEPVEPRTVKEMNEVEAKYKKADQIIRSLDGPQWGAGYFSPLACVVNDMDKETLAYVLKQKPDFFEALEKNYSPNELEQAIPALANKVGVEDVAGKTNEQLIDEMKALAAEVEVPERATPEERAERKDLDDAKAKADKIKAAVDKDKAELKMPEFKPKTTMPTEEELKASFDKNGFNVKNPDGKVSKSKVHMLKLAIATEDTRILDDLYDGLSAREKREILAAFIGKEEADKVDRNDLAAKIVEVSKEYAQKESERLATLQADADKVNGELAEQAVDIVARLKNDTENVKQYKTKDGSTVVYNTETKEGIIKHNDGTFSVVKDVDPGSGSFTRIAGISKEKIYFNTRGNNATEISLKAEEYCRDFAKYVKDIGVK